MNLSKPTIQLKILDSRINAPEHATEYSAGYDLRACIDAPITLKPNETALIGTGIAIYLDNPQWCAMLLPRSGLGHKHGIVLGNLVGLVDADYQGELKISLWNRSEESFEIKPLERIAQMVIVPIIQAQFETVNEFSSGSLKENTRGEEGFGSTGRA